jgi:hypothetical protein
MDTTTLYPIILRLFMAQRDTELTGDQRDQALQTLESWVVRRMICDYTTKNYNRIAVDLLQALSDDIEHADEVIADRFLKADIDTEIWPDDATVTQALATRPLYNRLRPVRRVRMILEACEIQRRVASGGFAEIAEQPAPQLGMSLQIEHVLPQKWREHWPVDPELTGEERTQAEINRQMHVDLLGNLTLITNKLNPSISNGPWPAKREALNAHSVLHLNRDLVTGHEHEWSEVDIDARGEKLAALICEHWARPESPAPSEFQAAAEVSAD